MKKRILLITVLSLFLVLTAAIEVKTYFYHRGMEVIRTEYYKNDSDIKYNNFDTLEIAYQRSGKSVGFAFEKEGEVGGFSCGADYVSENKAVYDGSLSLPSSYAYLEFVFGDGYVEVYDGKDSKYVYYLQDQSGN